jgi:hypothetical protein
MCTAFGVLFLDLRRARRINRILSASVETATRRGEAKSVSIALIREGKGQCSVCVERATMRVHLIQKIHSASRFPVPVLVWIGKLGKRRSDCRRDQRRASSHRSNASRSRCSMPHRVGRVVRSSSQNFFSFSECSRMPPKCKPSLSYTIPKLWSISFRRKKRRLQVQWVHTSRGYHAALLLSLSCSVQCPVTIFSEMSSAMAE